MASRRSGQRAVRSRPGEACAKPAPEQSRREAGPRERRDGAPEASVAARPDPERYLEIGRVLRPHGVRGELKVRPHWAESDALANLPRVHVVGSGVEQDFDVQWARPHDGAYLMKLAGLDAPEPAAPLRGATVFVERTLLPPLEPGEYYLSDLVGALVLCAGEDGPRELGRIEAVRSYETVDSAVVVTPDGRRLEQPLVEPFLAEVDIAERRVVLATLDGLID